ncbi:MAG: DUF465 domain-containing protein [Candidatus Adiutrix sp.]
MPQQEKEIIETLAAEHPQLKAWLIEHQEFETQLENLSRRPYLAPEEDLERKKIQKAKLAVKDKIQNFVDTHQG